MKIDKYFTEWETDCVIVDDRLDEASNDIPKLHAKYLRFLSTERITYKKLLENKKKLENKLDGYYSGMIDGKDIGRPPFSQILKTESARQKKIDSDDEVITYNLALIQQEEIMLFLKECVSSLNQRTFTIKNSIEFKKFIKGM